MAEVQRHGGVDTVGMDIADIDQDRCAAGDAYGAVTYSGPAIAPSAGGLHAISLVLLISPGSGGLYDDGAHRLLTAPGMEDAVRINRDNIMDLTKASAGVTMQLAADTGRYAACYDRFETLMWRDAGVLVAQIALIATALSLRSVILGRTGRDIVAAAGFDRAWTGFGAIHIGSADAWV